MLPQSPVATGFQPRRLRAGEFSFWFQAEIDSRNCSVCGVCASRCQMDAVREKDDGCEVDKTRCIGCGLCLPACPENAIHFVPKPIVAPVPENVVQMHLKIAQERKTT